MNYILKYVGVDNPDENKINRILQSNDVKVIDDSMSPKMILVELKGPAVNKIEQAIKDDWQLFPEQKYRVPDTRRKVKK